MLETFLSIIQFRQHIGSIHTQPCTHTHVYTGSVAMVSACFLHVPVTSVTCVMCWKAWWPKQPAAFPQGWRPLCSNNRADVGRPVQPERGSDSPSGSHQHTAKFSEGIPTYVQIFNRSNRCDVHETCRRPRSLGPISHRFLPAPVKLSRRQIKRRVMWYYRICYGALGCDPIGQRTGAASAAKPHEVSFWFISVGRSDLVRY